MTKIRFKDLNVKEITNSSGIFSGDNLQVKWTHHKKTSEGFGSVGGEKNEINGCQNVSIKINRSKETNQYFRKEG
ncbi:hypothetical protein [Aquibacillus salsiterrae]|uniref:Uncharacterized protein n=1 Tax=Aquibacillus salsiterrae TaxID=2950439 RepID=A0A9X3WD38_9BACI|nr:hypothetical protein [Aquibacillus salsiterrae]MDC3417387.1 hypothetical protein [Aquibacillus salsiterrae]